MSEQTTTIQCFTLDEEAAAEIGFAERYPAGDTLGAAIAIDQAAYGSDDDIVITGPEGWAFYVDLLANLDGEIDAYRIGVRPPGTQFMLASIASDSVPSPEGAETLDVLRWAVDTANQLIEAYQQR